MCFPYENEHVSAPDNKLKKETPGPLDQFTADGLVLF